MRRHGADGPVRDRSSPKACATRARNMAHRHVRQCCDSQGVKMLRGRSGFESRAIPTRNWSRAVPTRYGSRASSPACNRPRAVPALIGSPASGPVRSCAILVPALRGSRAWFPREADKAPQGPAGPSVIRFSRGPVPFPRLSRASPTPVRSCAFSPARDLVFPRARCSHPVPARRSS
jgi:hypothetical protein